MPPDSRIEGHIEDVDQGVDNHIYRGDEQGDALNHHDVALLDAADESCPKPW